MEDFDFDLGINLRSNFIITKAALPHLERTKGNILYISSVAGKIRFQIGFLRGH